MRRIYIAICLDGKCDWFKRQGFLNLVAEISDKIRGAGLEVVNLNTSGVKECPNAGIFECVRFADRVICICDEVSLGFGVIAWSAMVRLHRQGIAFIPANEKYDLGQLPTHSLVRRVSFHSVDEIPTSLNPARKLVCA